jgi:predicted TPR repeat methyltransferase
MSHPLTTDCPIAERRYAYGQAAARDGNFVEAAEVLEQALEVDAGWAAAWFALGDARQQLGDFEAAGAAFAEALRLDPDDHQGASPRLAAIEGRAVGALPRAYVARLFDDYAPRFEAHLTDDLGYHGPALLFRAITTHAPDRRYRRALDLGCGSGLAGAAFRVLVDELRGVDLSPGMIERARRAGQYEALQVGDVVEYLAIEPPARADLILAADVFGYLGELGPALRAAKRALAPDGLLAFTAESEPGSTFGLRETLRFRHSEAYLSRALGEAGLTALMSEASSARREGGVDVPGLVIVAGHG